MQLKELLDQYQPEDAHAPITQLVLASKRQSSPLIVKLLSIYGAWITSSFFLFFLLSGSLLKSPVSLLVFGALIFAVSIFWSQQTREKVFLEGVAVVFNIIGQSLIILGFMIEGNIVGFTQFCLIMIALDTIVIIYSPSIILQFGAVLALQGFTTALFFNQELYDVIHFIVALDVLCLVLMWTHESQSISIHPALTARFLPLSAASVASLEIIFLTKIYYTDSQVPMLNWIYSTLCIGLGLLYFQYREWQRYGLGNEKWIYAAFLVAIISLTLYSPGISTALLIISIGYHRQHLPFLSAGMLFLAIFLVDFYYNLSLNLLIKSGILFGTGLVCAGAALSIKKYSLQ